MLEVVNARLQLFDEQLNNRNADYMFITSCKNNLLVIKNAIEKSYGFSLVYSYIKEFKESNWNIEFLTKQYSLVTKRCLAQRLEFGDKIIEINKKQIIVLKRTGKEWVYLNDNDIFKRDG